MARQIYEVPGFFMLWVSFWKLLFLVKPGYINYLCYEIVIKIIVNEERTNHQQFPWL